MKIIILGAGISGITTAYFLAKAGYQVVVLEQNLSSAMACSYANGGQLSFSHIEPWNSFFSLQNIFKNSVRKNSFFSLTDKKDWQFYKWAGQFLKNSGMKNSIKIAEKLHKICSYSKLALSEILKEEKIDFDYKTNGILHFYRNQKNFNKAINLAKSYEKFSPANFEILDAVACVKKEATLIKLLDEHLLVGGIFYKNDASGDCAQFANKLAAICQEKFGVVFEYDTEIKNIFTNYKTITGINTDNGVFTADRYIYCLGAYGNSLLNGIGIKSGIYPIKGYSLSIPCSKSYLAPNLSITDSENKIVYSRFGNIFRAAGTIEVAGLDNNFNQKNIEFLKNTVRSTYSDFGDLKNAKEWFGYRPYTSDCLPIICKINKYGNLFINAGHGSLGWTNSFATARLTSELITKDKINPHFDFLAKAEDDLYCE